MGGLLEKPVVEKETKHGQGNGLRYSLSAMQGWRREMEVLVAAIVKFTHHRMLTLRIALRIQACPSLPSLMGMVVQPSLLKGILFCFAIWLMQQREEACATRCEAHNTSSRRRGFDILF